MLTLKSLNRFFESIGYEERLSKKGGYFYFHGGSSSRWSKTCVFKKSLNEYSLEEWKSTRDTLKTTEYWTKNLKEER